MNVHAEIITIGDEILIGQTVDTNSAWMGQQLNSLGIDIDRIVSIRDTKESIIHALDQVKDDTKLVFITGGLGPTKDDLTKYTLLDYFGGELIFNEEAYNNVERIFSNFGRKVSEVNRLQAMVPSSSKMILNEMGTAPAMHFEKNGIHYFSMPGVPYEMKHIMTSKILPWIAKEIITGHIIHKTIMTHGIGESALAEIIKDWEDTLPQDVKLAYLPSPGLVKLRLTGKGKDRDLIHNRIEEHSAKLIPLIEKYIFSNNEDSLQKVIGFLLNESGKTLATAESCTGGNIARLITSVPGSSAYFKGSVVAYDNEIKQNVLGVEAKSLSDYGAVSEAVVLQMAEGVRRVMNVDYGIATSGVAGPDGGTDEKPVGTVWIAVCGQNGCISKKFSFGTDRIRNIKKSSFMALDMLRTQLISK